MINDLSSRSSLDTDDKLFTAYSFIHDNFIYSKDPSLNKFFSKYDNQIEAIENTYVTKEGKKYHPAICNISSRMMVFYLRKLGIPAVEVGGYARVANTSYAAHAWVKYYDKDAGKWKKIDPTPIRTLDPIQYKNLGASDVLTELSSPPIITKGDLIKKKQRRDLLKKIKLIESNIIDMKHSLIVIKDKLNNSKNSQYNGFELKSRLNDSFVKFRNGFVKLISRYSKAETKKDRSGIKEKILSFEKRFSQEFMKIMDSNKSSNSSKFINKQYIELYFMLAEEVNREFPDLNMSLTRNLINDYNELYSDDKVESMTKSLGSLGNGRSLIIMNNKLYLSDKLKSFSSEYVMDLSGYSEYFDLKFVPNSDDWAFIAKKKNGKYVLIKNGKEMEREYEEIHAYDFSKNGDTYVSERKNEILEDGKERHFYVFRKNDQIIQSSQRRVYIKSSKDKSNVSYMSSTGLLGINDSIINNSPSKRISSEIFTTNDSVFFSYANKIYNGDKVLLSIEDCFSAQDLQFSSENYFSFKNFDGEVIIVAGIVKNDNKRVHKFFVFKDGKLSPSKKKLKFEYGVLSYDKEEKKEVVDSDNYEINSEPGNKFSYTVNRAKLKMFDGEVLITKVPMNISFYDNYVVVHDIDEGFFKTSDFYKTSNGSIDKRVIEEVYKKLKSN